MVNLCYDTNTFSVLQHLREKETWLIRRLIKPQLKKMYFLKIGLGFALQMLALFTSVIVQISDPILGKEQHLFCKQKTSLRNNHTKCKRKRKEERQCKLIRKSHHFKNYFESFTC